MLLYKSIALEIILVRIFVQTTDWETILKTQTTTERLGRRKSPTVAPGTDCHISKDSTLKSLRLLHASKYGGRVPVPGFALEATVKIKQVKGIPLFQLVVFKLEMFPFPNLELRVNLQMQHCMTWGIPQSEVWKLKIVQRCKSVFSKKSKS